MKNKRYLDNSLYAIAKRHEALNKLSVHCKNCGHTMNVLNADRIICNWCGFYVYKDDKTEFKYKILEKIKKK